MTLMLLSLELEVEMPAINKVPRRMINQAVSQTAGKLLEETGLSVVISVKDGEEIAKETLKYRKRRFEVM